MLIHSMYIPPTRANKSGELIIELVKLTKTLAVLFNLFTPLIQLIKHAQ